MNKMEKMIRKAHKMEELMDYDSLSLFPNARLPPKFKMLTLDKFDGTQSPILGPKDATQSPIWRYIWKLCNP